MHRNERTSIQKLLAAIHSTKEPRTLAPAWRNSVMAESARTGQSGGIASEFERLAPRIAFAAAALSVITLTTGTWALNALPDVLYSAYANDIYTVGPTIMSM